MKATTDLMDTYIARTTPAVMLPHGQALAPLAEAGHRYLVAKQGLFMEVRRSWVHAVLPIATSAVDLPFGPGPGGATLQLLCGAIPKRLLADFQLLAEQCMPNEVAAWIIWNQGSGEFKLQPLATRHASAARVDYERPDLAPGWELVLDLHSHPIWPASFSDVDDRDDGAAGEVKLCGVLGHVSTSPQWCFRLAAGGVFQPINGDFA